MFSEEAKLPDISLEGFQVVRSQYFSRMLEPAMTIWNTSIAFNTISFTALNNCDMVQILVHEKDKSIIVRPVNSKDPDAVNLKKNNTKYSRLECSAFAKQLFEMWGLDANNRYRTMGKVVQCDKKVMLYFNFKNAESWKGTKLVKEHD